MAIQRTSKQRELILEELRSVTSHPTADELYEMVRKKMPRVSLGTIYRNLDLLSSQGVILKLEAGGKKRFDGNPHPHPHLRCLNCGKMDDIHFDAVAPELPADQTMGYQVITSMVEYLGLCPDCQDSMNEGVSH